MNVASGLTKPSDIGASEYAGPFIGAEELKKRLKAAGIGPITIKDLLDRIDLQVDKKRWWRSPGEQEVIFEGEVDIDAKGRLTYDRIAVDSLIRQYKKHSRVPAFLRKLATEISSG